MIDDISSKARVPRLLVLTLAAVVLLSADNPAAVARPLATISVTIQADAPQGSITPHFGLLHGLDGSAPVSEARVRALKPRYWRLGKWESYDMAQRQPGLGVIFGVGSLYRWIKRPENARPWEDWDEWEAYLEQVLGYIEQRYPDRFPDFIDVWPEPNLQYFWGGSYDQLLELFARTGRVMQERGFDARLVGPSVSAYAPGAPGVVGVVDFVVDLEARHGLRLDAVSWHEFVGMPDGIPARSERLRRDLATRMAPGPSPELHVNEHITESRHLSPGWSLGYLYYLELAEIDVFMRACWTVRSDDQAQPWGGCWAGLSGLLMRDGQRPQPAYWIYEAYARSEGHQRLSASTSDPRTVALVDRDDDAKRIHALVGRYGGSAADVDLAVEAWPYGGNHALVSLARIPQGQGATGQRPRTSALPDGPLPEARFLVPIRDGAVSISIPAFRDGDVYVVEIVPAPALAIPLVGSLTRGVAPSAASRRTGPLQGVEVP